MRSGFPILIKRCLPVMISFLFFEGSAVSQSQWKKMNFPGQEPEDSLYAYQPSSLTAITEAGRAGLFKVWIRNNERKITLNGNQYRNVKTIAHWIIDCTNKQYRLSNVTYYDIKGNLIQGADDESQWYDAVPESVADAVITSMCPIWSTKQKKK